MHHLAWCIGRVCAVRPGSLGYNPKNKDSISRKKFLTWRDVKIFRGTADGEFVADFTFRVLKTNSEDPEEGNKDDRPPRPLQCRVLSPKKNENVIFSVPHRLLVIALRRGIIDGISTIDELLAGRTLNVQACSPSLRQLICANQAIVEGFRNGRTRLQGRQSPRVEHIRSSYEFCGPVRISPRARPENRIQQNDHVLFLAKTHGYGLHATCRGRPRTTPSWAWPRYTHPRTLLPQRC